MIADPGGPYRYDDTTDALEIARRIVAESNWTSKPAWYVPHAKAAALAAALLAAREEREACLEVLNRANYIINRLPTNGKFADALQKYGAAVSALKAPPKDTTT